MRRAIILRGMVLAVSLALSACGGGGGGAPSGPSGGEATAATASTPTPDSLSQIQEDVPILDGAVNLKVSSGGTVIRYEAPSTVQDATDFYQTQMAEQGWEQQNKGDSGFGDSITLLRSKPEQTISVTIQSIPNSDDVRVLITLSPK